MHAGAPPQVVQEAAHERGLARVHVAEHHQVQPRLPCSCAAAVPLARGNLFERLCQIRLQPVLRQRPLPPLLLQGATQDSMTPLRILKACGCASASRRQAQMGEGHCLGLVWPAAGRGAVSLSGPDARAPLFPAADPVAQVQPLHCAR